MTNLIERLRETASKGVLVWGDLQMEAADTLEALSSRNRQLVVESSKYCAEVSRGMSDTIRLMEERDALKVELQNSITRRQEQRASADFAVASLKLERDTLRAEVSKLDVLLEECKMNWSVDIIQLMADHKHEVDNMTYDFDMVDRFLRQNLSDDDYEEYSEALSAIAYADPRVPELRCANLDLRDEGIKLRRELDLLLQAHESVLNYCDTLGGDTVGRRQTLERIRHELL